MPPRLEQPLSELENEESASNRARGVMRGAMLAVALAMLPMLTQAVIQPKIPDVYEVRWARRASRAPVVGGGSRAADAEPGAQDAPDTVHSRAVVRTHTAHTVCP